MVVFETQPTENTVNSIGGAVYKSEKKEKNNYFIFSVMTEMTAGCGAVPKCKEKKKIEQIFVIVLLVYSDTGISP